MNRERLKNRRLQLGLTQQAVADMLGVGKPTYNRYESGAIKRIDTLTIEKLAHILVILLNILNYFCTKKRGEHCCPP